MDKGNWTREEHILAFNLYCKIPFTKINDSYPPVKELAKILGRSDGSVAMKLANFARLDPALKARNISGLKRGAKGEEEIWLEFYENWDELAFMSEKLRAKLENSTVEKINNIKESDLPRDAKERAAMVKVRVNQNFFRAAIMGSYNNTCCITGLKKPELLIASHINRWADDEKNRMNPQNGLAMNGLHDKAFENGLITITPEFHILVCKDLLKSKEENIEVYFKKYHEKPIILPTRFLPEPQFLANHFKTRFQG